MSRRRRTDLWDDFFEVMQWVFKHIYPAWSIPIAAAFLLGPMLWIKYKSPQASSFFYWLGLILGGVPACVTLAAGVTGWRYRRNRAAFLQQHLDIEWLNQLSWQDFEAQVAEMYRQQGYSVD